MKLRPIVKIHGGKFFAAEWIIQNLPNGFENMTWIEAYAGAASTTMQKPPSKLEVLNDLDKGIYEILSAVKYRPDEFIGQLKQIEYSEETFNNALENQYAEPVNDFVLRRMSRGGLKKSFAWSDRKRGGMPGDVNSFRTIIEQLPYISNRLQGVEIHNKPALDIIDQYDNSDTIFYLDPPYLTSTRQSQQVYDHEMNESDHVMLAARLLRCKAKVMISGYPSQLYDYLYKDWRSESKLIANHSSQQKVKQIKEEKLWMSF